MPTSPPAKRAGTDTAPRIGFWVRFPFHQEILGPIHELLKDEFPCLFSDDVDKIISFRPRILVVADRFHPRHRKLLPDTLLVFTRHGFISKNYAWGVIGESDFVCVSSPWVRADCIQRGWRPRLGFWATGFVPMDGILGTNAAAHTAKRPDEFSREGPTLLYAPTHNQMLNSVEMLGTGWIAKLRERTPNLNVIIKPHPHTAKHNPMGMEILQRLASENERTLLVSPDADIYPYMPLSDILLSDSSSVVFFYLALNRPIILVNNPRRFEEPQFFDPKGQEWTTRDMAIEIERAEDLPEAFRASVEHPEQKADRRAYYRNQVFGELLDGRAAERVAYKIRSLLRPSTKEREWASVVWNSIRTLGKLMKASEQPEVNAAAYKFDLNFYPQLRAAMQRQPELRSEIGRFIEDLLKDQAKRQKAAEASQPGSSE